jgi:hypothetical protein
MKMPEALEAMAEKKIEMITRVIENLLCLKR